MRKIFVLLFLASLAQLSQAQDFNSKLILGINACQVDGDQNGGYNKFGPRFGFGISYPISDKFDIGFEMLYSHKGSQTKQDKDNPSLAIIKYRYNYIEVPLLATYKFEKWSLHGGIAPAYLLGARADEGGGFVEMNNIKEIDVLSNIGASYYLSDKLHLEARSQYSLGSILKEGGSSSVGFIKTGAYHNVLSLSLHILFN